MRDRIFTIVNSTLVHDFLSLEGKKYRQGFRVKRPEAVDLTDAKREDGVETISLLPLKDRHLTVSALSHGLQALGGKIQLLFAVSRYRHCDKAEHHALVTGRKIGQEFLGLGSLQLHVVGDNS